MQEAEGQTIANKCRELNQRCYMPIEAARLKVICDFVVMQLENYCLKDAKDGFVGVKITFKAACLFLGKKKIFLDTYQAIPAVKDALQDFCNTQGLRVKPSHGESFLVTW